MSILVDIPSETTLISVRDGLAFVSRLHTYTTGEMMEQDAINHAALADAATWAVEAQGGSLSVSSWYSCPPELAKQAIYASDAEAPDLDGIDDESVFGILRRACRMAGHPELSEQATPDTFDAFAAVRRQMSPAAFQALATLYATGLDYHPYFSVLTPVVWARCVRLTPDQWMGLCEFVHARGLRREDVF